MNKSRLLYIHNDNRLKLAGLKDLETGLYINDGIVTVTLIDKDGNQVEFQEGNDTSWPLPLVYEADSDGDYAISLSKDLILNHGNDYFGIVTASGNGLNGEWQISLKATIRRK